MRSAEVVGRLQLEQLVQIVVETAGVVCEPPRGGQMGVLVASFLVSVAPRHPWRWP